MIPMIISAAIHIVPTGITDPAAAHKADKTEYRNIGHFLFVRYFIAEVP